MSKQKTPAQQQSAKSANPASDPQKLAQACMAALEADPEDVRALRVLGELMKKQGRFLQAAKLLDRAVTLAPGDGAAQTALGEALLDEGSLEAALAVLRRAATQVPDDPVIYRHTGRTLHRLARYEEAFAVTQEGLAKSPQDANLILLSGQCLLSLQRFDEARPLLEKAQAMMPEDPWPHLGIALIHMLRGELLEGFAEYRWRQKLPACQPRKFPQPYWWGGDAVGKTILVYAEQGLGDVLHFARYLPMLAAKGARVLLICDPALHPLLRGMDGVTLVQPNVRPEFDCHVSLLDLPDLFGTQLDNIPAHVPYLQVPSQRHLPPPSPGCRMRIGIAWAGNPKHNNSRNRDCTVEQFLPLAGRRGLEMFGLQVGKPGAALTACGGDVLITPLGQHLRDMGVTASVIAELDLVITVDTAVAHLAGALGKPTWLLLPYAPDWRWMLGRDDTPWYPSMRLFRQPAPGDWDSVFAAVGEALDVLLQDRPGQPPAKDEAVAQARQLRDRATAGFNSGNVQAARTLLRSALQLNPLDPSLWNNMGIFLRESKHAEAAEACYRRALDCGGQADAGLRTNLGNVLSDLDRCEEAVACHELALAMKGDPLLVLQNLGVALRGAGRHAEAVTVYDRLLEKSPNHHNARWDRSQSLLALGRYKEGWRDYESRWKLKEAGPYPRKGARWNGEPFAGKTLLLIAEQGFGDTLLAVRFLPQVKALGGRVLLECQPEVMRLLGKNNWVDGMFAKGTQAPEPYDFQLTMMSLPGLFVPDAKAIAQQPYLKADPTGHAMFANLLQKKKGQLNVGIVWSGSVTFKGNAYRAVELEHFLRFAAVPGVRLFSLQKGPPQEELKKLGLQSMVTDLSTLLLDFECTAAALEMLDLVIMTDSATAHLAGALGRPVWVLLGSRPYWLWGSDERTPWYPNMRLLRQRKVGDWEELFARAEAELREWAEGLR
ncbi:MAG: tetratricopeptide repeat protein [Nitrosomonadales bacterium]|nr:tetratricopeptide repeat protein [Nitrosomonadales bacterium]